MGSNVGGPNRPIADLAEMAATWSDGDPGCNCLICCRVPKVLQKLRENCRLCPHDVLPITTIPNLAHVVDVMLQPRIKIALGSQGHLGKKDGVDRWQEYPSAAVGFLNYPVVEERAPVSRAVSSNLDPKGVFQQNRAPEGYRYVYGLFWENDKDMKRPNDDPDGHAFGFVFVQKSAQLSNDAIEKEMYRFKPIPVPGRRPPIASPMLHGLVRSDAAAK